MQQEFVMDIVPTAEGIAVKVKVGQMPEMVLPLRVEEAAMMYQALASSLGKHFPAERADGDEHQLRPRMLDIGNVKIRTGGYSDGLVYLWHRPEDWAGLTYMFQPHQARDLAAGLIEAAEAAEAFAKPKN